MTRRGKIGSTPTKPRRVSPAGREPNAAYSSGGVEAQIARLTRERDEALAQQNATAEILQAISRSTFNLQSVLDTLIESATRLCRADHGWLFRVEDQRMHWVASFGYDVETHNRVREFFQTREILIDHGSVTGRALLEGKAVNVPDVLVDPNYTFGDVQKVGGYRAGLGAPLVGAGGALGVIFLSKVTPEAFDQTQMTLVTAFADQAVIAIENARLLNELRQRTDDLHESLQQQTATADVLKVISRSTFALQPVLDTLVASAAHLCNADKAFIFQRSGDVYVQAANYGFSEEFEEFARQNPILPQRGTVTGRVAVEGRTIHVDDVLSDPEFTGKNYQSRGNFRTCLGVPLLRTGEVIGVFFLSRSEVAPFMQKQIELVTTFADQAVIAIENVRLFEEVQAKTDDLSEALKYQTGSSSILNVIASSPTDVQPVLNAIVESACNLCEAYDAVILLKNGEELQLRSHHGPIPMIRQRWVNDRSSVSGRAMADRRSVHVHDILGEEGLEFEIARTMSVADGCRTLLGAPLLREGEPIGALVLRRAEVHPFSERQISLLQTFADQAVIAIENVRLFDEVKARTDDLQESLRQQTAVGDVLKIISRSTFDLQPVLDTLVHTAAQLCDADMAFILRREGDSYRAGAAVGFSPRYIKFLQSNPIAVDRGTITGRVALDRRVVQVPDVANDPEYTMSESVTLANQRTALGVPLLRQNEPIGVIVLARQRVEEFTPKQIELVTTFADQAVIAIENVRLFEELKHRTDALGESLRIQTVTLQELRSAQDRLVQTEKLASLGQLTAGIAHEIKNPLNFVNNFAALSAELTQELNDLLTRAEIADKTRAEVEEMTGLLKDNLGKVVQHGKRADSIVKNMLQHSREGSGERRSAEINAVVDESLNLAYHGARAEKAGFAIVLQREFDPLVGTADIYPQEITRALLNLISNGFYATTKRKEEAGDGFQPTLTAITKNLGDSVEICIRDNGSGIPQHVRAKIFNPFFTTKPPGEGTGLGLSMSHDIIVKQHGGSINVESAPGEFTEFTIVLPRTSEK
ncbi:MAG TPA: GAF domain-containing protein [Candidatus Acidoferrum sp.]|nr:GAF domain-containing protein [Candidatus Acidoferrum sp.]